MADRADDSRSILVEELDVFASRSFRRRRPGRDRQRWPDGWRRPERYRARPWWRRPLLWIGSTLLLLAILTTLFLLGPLDPRARTVTLASLPAPLAPGAYSRVAVDAAGWLWIGQSAPGLANHPDDTTLLTLIDPDAVFGDKVRAHLCIGCDGMVGDAPALMRIDDIAPDPTNPHAIFVAGWATAAAGGVPVVSRISWQKDAARCDVKTRCGTATSLLTTTTQVLVGGKTPFQTVLGDLFKAGARPYITLATGPKGDLFTFLSARGTVTLDAQATNVAGGYQGLFHYDTTNQTWGLLYRGPAGTVNAQRIGVTSFVTALAVAPSGNSLYLADADRHTILRFDLKASILTAKNPLNVATSPYLLAGALTLIAGAVVPSGSTDQGQGISGWQGDGGPALQANLGVPRGLAFDPAGDLLVSDATNGRVRLITPGGTIWSIAGDGDATIGSDNAPSATSLRGLTGIAAGTQGRIYLAPGAVTDVGGRVRVKALLWGWSVPAKTTFRAGRGGQGTVNDPFAGLPMPLVSKSVIRVLTAGDCAQPPTASSGCLQPYVVAVGGQIPGQYEPLAPARALTRTPMGGLQTPSLAVGLPGATMATIVPGSAVALVSGATPQIAFLPLDGTGADKPLLLPDGAQVTGVATLMPTTDALARQLGTGYLLIAAQGMAGGPALLIYRIGVDTCGIAIPAPPKCVHTPGIPDLAATIPLSLGTTTGSIAASLSDDGTHAFALVGQPDKDAVAIVDLTPLFQGAPPMLAAGLTVAGPGPIVMRHDSQGAYIGTSKGTIIAVQTTNWLRDGISAQGDIARSVALPIPSTAAITTMAISGDDSQLYVGATFEGKSSIAHLASGGFGKPQTPTLTATMTLEAHLVALALATGDQRLVALTTPAGTTGEGQLHALATHDPFIPARWLPIPIDLGAAAAPAGTLTIVG